MTTICIPLDQSAGDQIKEEEKKSSQIFRDSVCLDNCQIRRKQTRLRSTHQHIVKGQATSENPCFTMLVWSGAKFDKSMSWFAPKGGRLRDGYSGTASCIFHPAACLLLALQRMPYLLFNYKLGSPMVFMAYIETCWCMLV